MNRGKATALSNNEREFILNSITERIVLDKRDTYDYRDIEICIDNDNYGMVEARIGKTRVLTRVVCDVIIPKAHRPREGVLYFQVELTPLASPLFDIGSKNSQTAVEVCRLLERTIRDSRAVDLESLCVITGEKVWEIRVYVNILDHCGNLIDCATIATITALKHFKRPDVSICGQEVIIHPTSERLPIPLTVYHIPLCVTFAFFHNGDFLLVDPTDKEEEVMDGRLIVGANEHQEICALHLAGGVAVLPDQIIRCFEIAALKCKAHATIIQEALEAQAGQSCSPLHEVRESHKGVGDDMDTLELLSTRNGDRMATDIQEGLKGNIKILDPHTTILETQPINPWEPPSNSDSGDEDLMIIEAVPPPKEDVGNACDEITKDGVASRAQRKKQPTTKQDSNSEEDDVIILDADSIACRQSKDSSKSPTSKKVGESAVTRKRPRKKKRVTSKN